MKNVAMFEGEGRTYNGDEEPESVRE